ncbi:hypothetical protein EXS62_01800 [Candidatus Kaiserbacteria bacterium]|nr:hypothetical protein [Candidatus Kaiserbacteria bacterium]
MVIFFTLVLLVSAMGLVGIIAVRRWEISTGRVLFADTRPVAGKLLGEALHFVERRAPTLLRSGFSRLVGFVRKGIHVGAAWVVLLTERLLEHTLHTLRHTTAKKGEGEASPFLREVAEHKKSLQEKSDKQGAIYEE